MPIRDRIENTNLFQLLTGLLVATFLWLGINFEQVLGSTFGIMALGTGVLYLFDVFTDKRTIEIEREINRTRTVTGTFVAYFAYIALTFGLITIAKGFTSLTGLQSVVGLNSIAKVFADSVQALIFEGNKYLTVFALSLPVGMTETLFFFVILFELIFINTVLNIDPFHFSVRWLAAVFLISLGFMIYHSNAKGLEDNAAIISTLAFGVVTMSLILWEGQALGAVLLHVTANFSALIQKFALWPKVLSFGVLNLPLVQTVLTVGAVLGIFWALSQKRIIPQLTG